MKKKFHYLIFLQGLITFYFFLAGSNWVGLLSFEKNLVFSSYQFIGFAVFISYASVFSIYLQKINIQGKDYKVLFFCAISSFLFFAVTGPMIQPPSDPLEHFRRHYSYLVNNSNETFQVNRSLLTVAFNSLFGFILPESAFGKILWLHMIHALACTMLLLSIWVSTRLIGLNNAYAILAAYLSVLYSGTNRFSYYSYYSFAPSLLNLAFFFPWFCFSLKTLYRDKVNFENLLLSIFGLLMVPALYFNHRQEAAFYFFATFFLVTINILVRLRKLSKVYRTIWLAVICLFYLTFAEFTLMVLLKAGFVPKFGSDNIDLHVYKVKEYILYTKLSAPRFLDTLGIVGSVPPLISLFAIISLVFLPLLFDKWKYKKAVLNRIVFLSIPGIFPFFVYFVPGCLQIWVALVFPDVIWRFLYAGLPFVSIAGYVYLFGYLIMRAQRKGIPRSAIFSNNEN